MNRSTLALALSLLTVMNCGAQPTEPVAASGNFPTIQELPKFAADLSVRQAYRAIPHRQTSWRYGNSSAQTDEAEYLQVAFYLIDEGVRIRVSSLERFRRDRTEAPAALRQLIEVWSGIVPPRRLSTYHGLVGKALTEQRAYFADWSATGSGFSHGEPNRIGSHPSVQASSRALRAAYSELTRLYPKEKAENRDAFFDHHCALDFM